MNWKVYFYAEEQTESDEYEYMIIFRNVRLETVLTAITQLKSKRFDVVSI